MSRIRLFLEVVYKYPFRLFTRISYRATIVSSKISKHASVLPRVNIRYSKISDYSYVGSGSSIIYANVGKYCSIAENVRIGGGNHPINWVSTSPVFCKGRNTLGVNFSLHEFSPYNTTIIGNDVWIGNNALIKSGITVGDGAIIGMGSVVTKDVEPYSIVAGNPAVEIRKRFESNIVNSLRTSQWWNFSTDRIKEQSKYFNDPIEFIRGQKLCE